MLNHLEYPWDIHVLFVLVLNIVHPIALERQKLKICYVPNQPLLQL
jgi:hypothetical protein